VLRLRTLGGVYVASEEGEPIVGAATQRRLLALLTVLAVAGDRGCSREKLVALLWPEADEERARHSLTQALYEVRRALGVDDVFLVGGDIRLNRQQLSSDVREMEEALDEGELERAVALYSGPFADGFFLPGSGEFEQWVSAQRARLEDRIALALDRLAGQAEEAGQLRDALDLRKRLAAIRPLDTSAAVALMTTFAFAGDRAGALQYARVHEVLLKEQLGLDPDPAVVSLVARLREPVSTVGEAPAGDADDPEQSVAGGPAAVLTIEASRPGPRAWRVPGARWWWSVPAIAAALVLALMLLRPRPVAREAPDASLDQKVVVAPFRVAGASSSLAYLREGMVELLSTRLADDSSARSVDAGAVLAAWRAAGMGSPIDVPRSSIVGLARGLGAEQVVIGSVVGGTSRLVITATVVEAASQRATAQVTVEGPADSISGLVDRLAARLLVLDAGEDASLASRTTESLPALRAFLGGQEAFRQGSYSAAVRYYEAALRLDSTFALAALQLARAADRMSTLAPQAHALALAWRERDVLDARARALLIALAGPSYPMPSEGEDQIDAWERLIDLTPDRAESWFELALRLVQEGAAAGATDAHSRGVWALRRALQLDPGHIPARELIGSITDDATADSALPLAPFWPGVGRSPAVIPSRSAACGTRCHNSGRETFAQSL
jgi:DNA-binding SARP family transcriptional activator/TolB-like protein